MRRGIALRFGPVVLLGAFGVLQRWMHDDAFILLRVVRNLLAGHGPVYNLGERVEVYTSPLWIAVLSLLGTMGLRLEVAAVWSGIALTCAGLALATVAGGKLVESEHDLEDPDGGGVQLPLGALAFALLPAAWDYASSGLETGLSFAWLGGAFALLVGSDGRTMSRRAWFFRSVFLSLGPLVRPELALYAGAFTVALARSAPEPDRSSSAPRWVFAAGALALPVLYQVFRMGYFATLTPTPALAKEAFLLRPDQGFAYARNFFGLYGLFVPIVALGLFVWLRTEAIGLRASTLTLLPIAVGGVHVVYVVLIGGDYMHARMFLPAVFAMAMPVSVVRVRLLRSLRPSPNRGDASWRSGAALAVLGWVAVVASSVRVPLENEDGIGDERGWYARNAEVDHPVLLADYAAHDFFKIGRAKQAMLATECPPAEEPCRRAFVGDDPAFVALVPQDRAGRPRSYALNPSVDRRVTAAVDAEAIGMIGFLLPATVLVSDHRGLADPVGARMRERPGVRPGHEKAPPNAWAVAWLSTGDVEDPRIVAARRALACGVLARLERAVRAPLTIGRFVSNLGEAWTLQRLRVASDPVVAERELCNTSLWTTVEGGGGPGGTEAVTVCPVGQVVTGLWVTVTADRATVTSLRAACRPKDRPDAPARPGTLMGMATPTVFELTCPRGHAAIGITGRADDLLHQIGIVCAPPGSGPSGAVPQAGKKEGAPFEASCPSGASLVAIEGRAGTRVDAANAACQ